MERLYQYLLERAVDGFISLRDEYAAAESFGVSIREVDEAALKSGLMPGRYRRNNKTISVEDQRRLLEASVIVVGCGGLGGYLIEELARLGVGTIKAVDPDIFEEHNLNRQILSHINNLGLPKASAALERVSAINPAVRLIPIKAAFSAESASEMLSHVNVAVDALDSIHTRLVLIEQCKVHGIPLVHGSIGGWYGQISVQYPEDNALQRLFEGRPDRGIEVDLGNPAFTPAVVASIETVEVCKIILGTESPLKGKVLVIDLKDMAFIKLGS